MRLAAATTVRNECDVIEAFVRHNAAFFDCLYILDHRSTDATPVILRKLADEGLPVLLSREEHGIFYQSSQMTRLIKRAFGDYPWDFIVPLDGDEFLHIRDRATLEGALADLDTTGVGLSNVVSYVPTEKDDLNEMDVLRRIVHRAATLPDIGCKIGKVIIPGELIKRAGFALNEGHHGVSVDGKLVPERWLDALSLAHFPVRSIDQFILRTALCRLAWISRSDYHPGWVWQYEKFVELLKRKPSPSVADLTEAALVYLDIYGQPGETRHHKVLVREPVVPAYDRLRYQDLVTVAFLPPILDMMDVLVDELRTTRAAAAVQSDCAAAAAEGASATVELFCLRSFIDWGHAVDLYTYDTSLVVPAGVRVCDAAELIAEDRVFVYQAEGFGKGSPSAFSNFFRYTLLVEKGGWWIDTDVVCLTDRIPVDDEFFARQDADFVAPGTMYFEPRHPVMMQCLEQATKLGRNVKWGDTGPRLFTRVLEEQGRLDRAAAPSVCYPIHYSQAVEVLRPSRAADLAARIEPALFLHVWNSTLVHCGVQKGCRPPKGSLLRSLMDRHPVDGWVGEYDEQTLEHALSLKAELHERVQLHIALGSQIAESERVKVALERSQMELKAMRASTSWRLTAPVRLGGTILRALRSFRREQ
jgi:Glycosyl transferase family 2/Alpha 1,4-glycosyltransferase conserved region/Glycosyltransferase sugar-binding region containing DXD motif